MPAPDPGSESETPKSPTSPGTQSPDNDDLSPSDTPRVADPNLQTTAGGSQRAARGLGTKRSSPGQHPSDGSLPLSGSGSNGNNGSNGNGENGRNRNGRSVFAKSHYSQASVQVKTFLDTDGVLHKKTRALLFLTTGRPVDTSDDRGGYRGLPYSTRTSTLEEEKRTKVARASAAEQGGELLLQADTSQLEDVENDEEQTLLFRGRTGASDASSFGPRAAVKSDRHDNTRSTEQFEYPAPSGPAEERQERVNAAAMAEALEMVDVINEREACYSNFNSSIQHAVFSQSFITFCGIRCTTAFPKLQTSPLKCYLKLAWLWAVLAFSYAVQWLLIQAVSRDVVGRVMETFKENMRHQLPHASKVPDLGAYLHKKDVEAEKKHPGDVHWWNQSGMNAMCTASATADPWVVMGIAYIHVYLLLGAFHTQTQLANFCLHAPNTGSMREGLAMEVETDEWAGPGIKNNISRKVDTSSFVVVGVPWWFKVAHLCFVTLPALVIAAATFTVGLEYYFAADIHTMMGNTALFIIMVNVDDIIYSAACGPARQDEVTSTRYMRLPAMRREKYGWHVFAVCVFFTLAAAAAVPLLLFYYVPMQLHRSPDRVAALRGYCHDSLMAETYNGNWSIWSIFSVMRDHYDHGDIPVGAKDV